MIFCTLETIATVKERRTVLFVTPSEHSLGPSIRALALTLAVAEDAGWDVLRIRGHLPDVVPHAHPAAPTLADVLIAAHAVLVGVDPDLAGLAEAWPAVDLSDGALLTTRWLQSRFGAA